MATYTISLPQSSPGEEAFAEFEYTTFSLVVTFTPPVDETITNMVTTLEDAGNNTSYTITYNIPAGTMTIAGQITEIFDQQILSVVDWKDGVGYTQPKILTNYSTVSAAIGDPNWDNVYKITSDPRSTYDAVFEGTITTEDLSLVESDYNFSFIILTSQDYGRNQTKLDTLLLRSS